MRQIKINNNILKEIPYTESIIYLKIYQKNDNYGYEVFTWYPGTPEVVTGNSDNIELLYLRVTDNEDPEILRGEMIEGLDLGEFTEQDKLDYYKLKKKEQIASDRYDDEISGIEVNGVKINTERDSQALITGAALAAMRDNSYTLKWKSENGFIELNSEQVIAMANLVREHVQNCFNREAECDVLIDACNNLENLNNISYYSL